MLLTLLMRAFQRVRALLVCPPARSRLPRLHVRTVFFPRPFDRPITPQSLLEEYIICYAGASSFLLTMVDYEDSSQLNLWMFKPDQLEKCRERANREARVFLTTPLSVDTAADSDTKPTPPVYSFAAGYAKQPQDMETDVNIPSENAKGHAFVTPQEESLLIAFYASKLPSLIGPLAQVPRLRRDAKVTATAALLFRRFFLSNSVMLWDPKAIMVAAAFLGSKVEDATSDVRYLEEGTKLMNAPVTLAEIIPAELALVSGINFDLLCFHPYKAVLAFTEDLRTYLKSEKGRSLAHFQSGEDRPVVGQDLKPMHDMARKMIDDAIVSDVPLLYSPGQVGLAALMVANDELQKDSNANVPNIDLLGYIQQRFDGKMNPEYMKETMYNLCSMLKGLKEGWYGCGNRNVDLTALKAVHKKLKKCRLWGKSSKNKKRKNGGEDEPEAKKAKTSA